MLMETFRKLIKWLGVVALLHAVAMLVFGLFFSHHVASLESMGAVGDAANVVLIFDVAVNIVFVLIYSKALASFSDYSKSIRDAMKDPAFTVLGYYKKTQMKLDLLKVAVFAVFQLPFLIFYSIFGVSFLYITSFEQFYIFEAGYYAAVGIPILGFLIADAVFAAALMASSILNVFEEKRSL